MAKKTHIDANTIESRLNDLKSEYDFNKSIIEEMKVEIKSDDLIVMNGNNTQSPSPALRIYMDLIKTNMSLRKQINEMELLKINGTLNDEANPFE